MTPHLCKMEGAGNDFLIMQWEISTPIDTAWLQQLCHRKRGIGADGMIFLSHADDENADIVMQFYNCDGSRADMCGNGLRCVARYASEYMNAPRLMKIRTDVGVLTAEVMDELNVKIQMQVVQPMTSYVIEGNEVFYCNTGVPHCVVPLCDCALLSYLDINEASLFYRHYPAFVGGANIDWIAWDAHEEAYRMRTFERGVEAETLACGTGATAVALYGRYLAPEQTCFKVYTVGNDLLTIMFESDIPYLVGPAKIVAKIII